MNRKGKSLNKQEAVQIIKQILQISYVRDDAGLTKEFQVILKRLEDKVFRIAIVGEFSSGKSTFINALLGKDILKHGVQETTATITEIINDPGQERAEVLFANGRTEKLNSFDDLAEYTATSSKHHHVADEIVKVTLYTPAFAFDDPVVFIDTPGLNGIADNHREKTLDIIQKAHACIYLLQKRGLGDSDTDFIKLLTRYQQQFLFVQNFIDTLQVAEGETPEEKIASQKKLLAAVLKDYPDVTYQVVGVSALDALRAQDSSVDEEVLTDEEKEKLYQTSRMAEVKKAIWQMVQDNKKNLRQQKTAIAIALQRLHVADTILATGEAQAEQDWQDSAEGQSQQKREKIIALLKANIPKHEKSLADYIGSESSKIKRLISSSIEEKMDPLQEAVKEKIDGYSSINGLRDFVKSRHLEMLINDKIGRAEDCINQDVQAAYTHLYQNVILQVQMYSGSSTDVTSKDFKWRDKIDFDYAPENLETENPELQGIKDDLERNEIAKSKLSKQLKDSESNQRSLCSEKASLQSRKRRIDDDFSYQKRRLGARPQVEKKTREETYYRKRTGLFSFFTTAVLGDKKDTRTVTYTDDTRRKEWDNKYNRLANDYNREKSQLLSQERQIASQQSYLQDRIRELKQRQNQVETTIDQLYEQLEVQKKQLKLKEQANKKQFLDNLKQQVKRNVQDYFAKAGGSIEEGLAKACDTHAEQIKEMGNKYYRQIINLRLNNLEQKTETAAPTLADKYRMDRKQIQQAIYGLEGEV